MARGRRPKPAGETPVEQQMRDQEVLRANLELAAYFKGRRTEREARAALKTIKAYVRDRERRDPRSRPPLPGRAAAKEPGAAVKPRIARKAGKRRPRNRQREVREKVPGELPDRSVDVPGDTEKV